jgi:class 3 adenylate cyclase
MKIIKARQKLTPLLIIVSWLIIVFVPVFVFKLGFKKFLDNHFSQSRTRIEPQLYNELQYFSRDLNEETMLKQLLNEFDQANHFKKFSAYPDPQITQAFSKLSAEKLRAKLQQHLDFELLSLWTYSVDTSQADYSLNKKMAPNLDIPSKTMLKRMFSLLNRQQQKAPVFPEQFKSAFLPNADLSSKRLRKLYGREFLQLYFSTLHLPDAKPGKLIKTISGKAGQFGNIFLYYSAATIETGRQAHNLGGYLAAFRLKDVPESQIINFATQRSFYEHLHRKIFYKKNGIDFPDNYQNVGLSNFYTKNNSYCLSSIIPQQAIVRRVQKGTLYPLDFRDFKNHTLVMQASVPLARLEHPLQKYAGNINLLINLLFLAGSAIFIRLQLFGLNFKTSIAWKVMFATVISCLMPIASLFILNLVYEDYETTAFNDDVRGFIEQKNSLIQQKIDDAFKVFQSKTIQLGAELVKNGDFSSNKLENKLLKWCKENLANAVIVKKFDSPDLTVITSENKKNTQFMQSWAMKRIFFYSLIEVLFTSPLIGNEHENYSQVLTSGGADADTIHQAMATNGRLLGIPRISKNSRMSGIFLQDLHSKASKAIGALTVDYAAEKILEYAFNNSFQDFVFAENIDQVDVDIALVKFAGNQIELVPECNSARLNDKEIERQIKKCSNVKAKIWWSEKSKQKQNFYLVNFAGQLPYAIFIKASKPLTVSANYAVMLLYPLLLLAQTLLLSIIFFIRPATLFSKELNIIAQGNLAHHLTFNTGDEFSDLANQFNHMTQSLIEKEQLERFVSSAALEEIKKSTESELRPGGEKIQATIVFSSFKNSRSETTDSQAAIDRLDLFLGICDSICNKNLGIIDKIIGDTIMMVFRQTNEQLSHEVRACNSALEIHQAMLQQNDSAVKCFSGLCNGEVISGKIGSRSGKLDYTVIGDTVNMAARLKSQAEKRDNSSIVIASSIKEILADKYRLETIEPVKIKGKQGKFNVYNLIG